MGKWQETFLKWKGFEKGFAPSAKYRKNSVDWRRQMERGTMHYGRWYEGPNGSDYRPGNTHDRLANVTAPFTDAEWEERKNYRSFDLMKFGYMCLGLFLAYRVTNDCPWSGATTVDLIRQRTSERPRARVRVQARLGLIPRLTEPRSSYHMVY